MFDCHQLDGDCIAAHAHRSNPKLAGPCISETPSGTDVSTLVEQVNYDHLAKVLTRATCGLAYPCIKYEVVGQRWTGMRRCRAPSRLSAAFCPCQSWAPDLVSERDSGARMRMMFPLASARLRRGLTALTCPTSPDQLQPLRGSGNLLRDPNWLLASGFCRSRRWLGYHNRIGNCLRNIDRFRAGLMNTNHARPP